MKKTIRNTFLAAAVLGLLTSLGCKTTDKSPSSDNHNSQLSAHPRGWDADSKFETSQDPPVKAQTRFAAGQVAETQGDMNRAIAQYWEAVKLDPKCKQAYYRLGIVYCELHHYPDAIVAWKQYVKHTGGEATAYANLGFCYELAGKHADAEDAFKKGIEKDPRNNACRVNYGLMLVRDNRVNEGIVQLQTVLSEAEVHYNLASVFEHTGRKDQARAEYRKALDIDPQFADAAVRLSTLR